MKHHLRKEKNCLNCGGEVTDRFCSHCGQENLELKESLGHLIAHFFSDVTHYDSKFLTTIKYLLFRPGFLSRQYFQGKRTMYLNPVRMYVFISFIFFLVLFLKKKPEPVESNIPSSHYPLKAVKQQLADSLHNSIKEPGKNTPLDSLRKIVVGQIASQLDTLVALKNVQPEAIGLGLGEGGLKFTLQEEKYNTVKEYDSIQNTLPDSARDKGFLRWIIRTNVRLKSKYGSRSQVVVSENFEHSVPKLMFILLPLFAWFIYIFHSRKKFYYTQHVIFSIQFHSFAFLLFLIVTISDWILITTKIGDNLVLASIVIAFFYLTIALKTTYNQSLFFSIIKALSIGILYIVALTIGIVVLAFISFITA